MDDLHKVISAVVRIRLLENYERLRRGMPDTYLYDIPRSWWSSTMMPDHEVGRQVYEDVLALLDGHPKPDQRLRANLLMGRMPLEFRVEASDRNAMQAQEKWLPILVRLWSGLLTKIEGANSEEETTTADTLYKVYEWWINFALRHGRIGSIVQPALGTVRQIFREKWNAHAGRFRGEKLLYWLMANDKSAEGLGDVASPQAYTIRGLFRELFQDGRCNAQLLIHWAQMEAEAQNLGEVEAPADFTARWIFREGWKNTSLRSAQLLIHWAQMEAEAQNLGEVEAPADFTARWIFREGWKNTSLRSAQLLIHWAQMEAEAQNLGEVEAPADFTARWIFREGWKNTSLRSAQLLIHWAQMEAETQNLGEVEAPPTSPLAGSSARAGRIRACEARSS